MNVFKAVKQSVTTRQAAEHFGIRVGRNGMCVCPFHADKNPSMKVDRRFHCFGCQADGDVIDFVSRLEAVSPKEAALMLAQEFSIPYEDREPPGRRKPKPRQETPEQRFCRMERYCFRVLSDYYHLLRRWKRDYAPKMPEEAWHPLFVEALQKQSHVEYLLDLLYHLAAEFEYNLLSPLHTRFTKVFFIHPQLNRDFLSCLFSVKQIAGTDSRNVASKILYPLKTRLSNFKMQMRSSCTPCMSYIGYNLS